MEGYVALEAGDPRKVGPYRIVARLGGGGMGHVYLGKSRGGRAFAVKVIRPELACNDDFRRRFVREVASARRVNGVFTAGVVDADPEGSPAWLATAYVPGIPLDEAITAHGPWREAPTTALAAALTEALEAIHTAGVVHRDLKPSNVLLAADGPRVIDFGISLPQASAVTAITGTGEAVGTPGFMSPEQLMGTAVGAASDVFSLGAVLALVASGSAPFGHGSVPEVMFRVAYREPDLDGIPPRLREVVARCLAKDPQQRPTVGALLDELADSVNGDHHDATFTTAGWLPEAVARDVAARSTAPQLLADPPDTTATPVHAGVSGQSPGGVGVRGQSPAGVLAPAATTGFGEPDVAAFPGPAGAPSVTASAGTPLATAPGPTSAGPAPGPGPSGPLAVPHDQVDPHDPHDPRGHLRQHGATPHRPQPGTTPSGPSSAPTTPSHRPARRKRSKRGLWVITSVCGVLGIGVVMWLVVPFAEGGDRHRGDSSARDIASSAPPGVAPRSPAASSSASSSPTPSPTASASVSDPPTTSAAPSPAAAPPSATRAAEHTSAPPAKPSSTPKPKPAAPSSYFLSYDNQSYVARGSITWGARSVTISGTITQPSDVPVCAAVQFVVSDGGPGGVEEPTSCDGENYSFTMNLTQGPQQVAVTLVSDMEEGGVVDQAVCHPSSGCH